MPHDSDTEASSDLSDVDFALLIDTDDPIPTPDTIDSSELLPSTIRKTARKGRAPRAVEAWKRARPGGEVVEHTECSEQWQKAGIAYSDIYDTYGSDSEVEDNDTNHYSPTTSSQGTTDDS